MTDVGQKGAWSILVEAGPHLRRALPVSVVLPISSEHSTNLSPPLLIREGRQRPIPCQLVSEGSEVRAYWLVDAMKHGEKNRYRLSLGARQRQTRTRMHIDKSPTGWTVSDEELRIADFLAPMRGTPRLTLLGTTGRLATLEYMAMPRWFEGSELAHGTIERERSLHRVQSNPVSVTHGPMLASFQASYDYLDRHDRRIVAETYLATFFISDHGIRVVDLDIRWEAVAEGLTMVHPDRHAYQRLPVLKLQLAEPIKEEIINDAGRIGQGEVLGRPAGGIILEQRGTRLGLFGRSATIGFPPCWERWDESSLIVVPTLMDPRVAQLGHPIGPRGFMENEVSADHRPRAGTFLE